jgi:mannosyl-3-phosphoglycerate phosphatase
VARLRGLRIPLIASTSKTRVEAAAINTAMANPHPCTIENGSAVCVPAGYFPKPVAGTLRRGFEVVRSGRDYGLSSILY